MPDFSRPEYSSYVALCRELRLEHELVDGEQYVEPDEAPETRCVGCENEYGYEPSKDAVWLPQFSEWFVRLLSRGVGRIEIELLHPKYTVNGVGPSGPKSGTGATSEEAIARLAIAVGAVKVKDHA